MDLWALFLVAVVLAVASFVSLLQTVKGFSGMADASLTVFTFPLGLYLPWVYGILFQYGQNAALYIKTHYCDDSELFSIGDTTITSNNIATGVFLSCLAVDVATNCVWFYFKMAWSNIILLNILFGIIGYVSMFLIAWSEEVLGIVLTGLRKVRTQYKSIKEREKAQEIIEQRREPQKSNSPSTAQDDAVRRRREEEQRHEETQRRLRQRQAQAQQQPVKQQYFTPSPRPAPAQTSEPTYHQISYQTPGSSQGFVVPEKGFDA